MDRLLEYASNHPLLTGAAVLAAVIVLGYELRQRANASATVSSGGAVRLMNDGATLLDVRAANQFKDGHVAGARSLLKALGPEWLVKLSGPLKQAGVDRGNR